MYTIIRIYSESDCSIEFIIKELTITKSYEYLNDNKVVIDILNDNDIEGIDDITNTWYDHEEAILHFINVNSKFFKEHDFDYHLDIAVYPENYEGLVAKCLPMSTELIKILAEHNISFEVSFYCNLDEEDE